MAKRKRKTKEGEFRPEFVAEVLKAEKERPFRNVAMEELMKMTDSDGELSSETIKGIERGRIEIKEGKGMKTKELMKKLDSSSERKRQTGRL